MLRIDIEIEEIEEINYIKECFILFYIKLLIISYTSRDNEVNERKVLLDKNSKEKQTSYRYLIDSPLFDK